MNDPDLLTVFRDLAAISRQYTDDSLPAAAATVGAVVRKLASSYGTHYRDAFDAELQRLAAVRCAVCGRDVLPADAVRINEYHTCETCAKLIRSGEVYQTLDGKLVSSGTLIVDFITAAMDAGISLQANTTPGDLINAAIGFFDVEFYSPPNA